MVSGLRFELRLIEPHSTVLPLHHRADLLQVRYCAREPFNVVLPQIPVTPTAQQTSYRPSLVIVVDAQAPSFCRPFAAYRAAASLHIKKNLIPSDLKTILALLTTIDTARTRPIVTATSTMKLAQRLLYPAYCTDLLAVDNDASSRFVKWALASLRVWSRFAIHATTVP